MGSTQDPASVAGSNEATKSDYQPGQIAGTSAQENEAGRERLLRKLGLQQQKELCAPSRSTSRTGAILTPSPSCAALLASQFKIYHDEGVQKLQRPSWEKRNICNTLRKSHFPGRAFSGGVQSSQTSFPLVHQYQLREHRPDKHCPAASRSDLHRFNRMQKLSYALHSPNNNSFQNVAIALTLLPELSSNDENASPLGNAAEHSNFGAHPNGASIAAHDTVEQSVSLDATGPEPVESGPPDNVNERFCSDEDFRLAYLRKLSYADVWVPQARRPPKHQSLAIFDWDDTLLCTTYFSLKGGSGADAALAAIEQAGIALLTTALRLNGRVCVVTNAVRGWVEHSAKQYLPGLLGILSQVEIISARHKFEAAHPGNYHVWKTLTLLEVRDGMDVNLITNIMSVGDSNIEMDAVRTMGKGFEHVLVKTIKFRENPSPDELAKQLQLLAAKFEQICFCARNLRIRLERRGIRPRDRVKAGSAVTSETQYSDCGNKQRELAPISSSTLAFRPDDEE